MGQYTGQALWDFLIALGGNVFAAILIFKGLSHWAKAEYGPLIGLTGSGILVAAFIYFPDQVITFFSTIISSVI